MRSLVVLFCLSSTIAGELTAQTPRLRISYTNIGTSAISTNTITAKTLGFTFPIYDYKADTLNGYLFISGRQKDEGSGNYLSRGFCTSISSKKDTALWLNESGLYDITVADKNLLISNELRSARFNKNYGFDELKYDSRVFY